MCSAPCTPKEGGKEKPQGPSAWGACSSVARVWPEEDTSEWTLGGTQVGGLGGCLRGSPSVSHFSLVAQSRLTLCSPMDCSMPGFPVHH